MVNIVNKPAEPAVEVLTHDVAPLTVNTDAGAYARLGWIIVLFGVLGFLLWASFAPLDKGVPLSGTVAKEGNRKAVQHQTGGTVQEILVKDGDFVKTGQVLVRMNSVQAGSALEMSVAQYIAGRAAEARLTAELTGAKTLAFPPSLLPYKDDPRVRDAMALQTQLLSSRRMALESDLGAMSEAVAGIEAQAKGLEEARDSKKAELGFLREQLENSRELAKDGYIPRSRLLELERTFASVSGAVSEDIGNIARARRQIAEQKLRRNQRSQEYQREVRSQLSDVQKETESMESRIKGQHFEFANAEVRAPVDGVVVGSSIFTQGGVVGPGVRMMDIVPTEDALVVEGQLAVNLIDRVHAGLPVELHFSAFNTNKTPQIPGTVIQVGADRTVDEKTGQPYYKVRARVTPEGAKLIAEKKLDIVAGMPVELFIKTGERTMMNYLLKPIFDRSHSALTEE
ncbi:MAG: HlyD family type I secretion periplasmic adaptor subunit [Duganella sp.]